MFITSYTFLLHLVLASHGAILTSQLEELHVSFISSKYSIVTVKAQTGCDDSDPSGGKMMVEVYTCPMNTSSPLPPYTIKGVCKEDGAKFCLSPFFRHAGCVMMKGKMGALEYLSSELSLTNTTFYNWAENNAASTSWVQEGNTSVLHFLPVAGVPVYKLMLKATSNNMSDKCGTLWLTGDTEASSSTVVFKAHWHQQVIPSCTYSTCFMPEDGCGGEMLFGCAVELPQLQYKHPTNKRIALEPVNTRVYVAALGTSSLLLLVVLVLFFVTLHQARKRQRIPALTTLSLTPLKRCEVSSSPRPTVLLVYTPDLLPQMADLATHLKKLTGLQIEDLHDVEDQDKLNDPTVWLTRRLMDANTRFVLACSSARQENKESSEQLQEGSIVHFLLDHFLQYLHSSSLAYDYTRLHHVRLEDQAQVDMSDVTPGRVYQLPAHLPQLARNLTIATPTTTTNPSDTPSAACEA